MERSANATSRSPDDLPRPQNGHIPAMIWFGDKGRDRAVPSPPVSPQPALLSFLA